MILMDSINGKWCKKKTSTATSKNSPGISTTAKTTEASNEAPTKNVLTAKVLFCSICKE